MKNLETMPAEEMRSMLRNISNILDTPIPLERMVDQIGMEFFEEGIPVSADTTLNELLTGMNEDGQIEFVKSLNIFIKSENEHNPEITLDGLLNYAKTNDDQLLN